MAEKLTYTINVCTSNAVQEIQNLEKEIARLKKELANTENATLGFDTLSSAIEGLEKKYDGLIQKAVEVGDITIVENKKSAEAVKELNKETEKTQKNIKGISNEIKKGDFTTPFKSFVKVGSAFTASFAAAQSIFATFGAESEEIAAAAAKAQSLLTVAIAAREAAEALGAVTTANATLATSNATLATEANTVAEAQNVVSTTANATATEAQTVAQGAQAVAQTTATVATEANTAANVTQIGVLQRLYAVMLANPFSAVLAGLGLLVTAYFTFSKSVEDANKAQKEIAKVTSDEANQLEIYVGVLNDVNTSNEQRLAVIDDLKEKYPGFNALLDDENRLNALGTLFIDLKTKSLTAEAKARVIVDKIAENSIKIREIENRTTEESLTLFDKFSVGVANRLGFYDFITGKSLEQTVAQKNNREELDKLTKSNEQYEAELRKVLQIEGSVQSKLKEIEDILRKAAKAEGDLEGETGKTNKATLEQIMLAKQLENELKNQETTIEKTLETFKKLAEAGGFDIAEPEALERVKELRANIEGLIPDDLAQKFKAIGLDVAFENGKFALTAVGNELQKTEDNFIKFVEKVRENLTAGIFTQDIATFGNTINTLLDEASLLFQRQGISKQQFEDTKKYLQLYKDLNITLKSIPESAQKIFTPEVLTEFLDITKQIAIAEGDIQFEEVNGEIIQITNSTVQLSQQTEKLTTLTKKLGEELKKSYAEDAPDNQKFLARVSALEKAGDITKEQAEELRLLAQDTTKALEDLYDALAKAQIKAVQNTVNNIVKIENETRQFLLNLQKNRTEALQLQNEAEQQIFLNNLDAVYKFTQEQNGIRIDGTKNQEEQILKLKEDFGKKGIDLTKFTEEEIVKILEFYSGKQKAISTERIGNILKGIQEFQAVLNSLAQTTTLYFNAQFDVLDRRFKKQKEDILEGSIDVTKKRLELEKIYQAERAELEKKAAKRQLQISLAQAIANTAGAIAKTFEVYGGTPVAVAAAALVATLNATQVAIIGNQLASINNYRRGGRIKMAGGGLVQGPAHEYGGVKFQGGGVELEGNEAVINRVSTVNFMGLLDQINQAGGGKPIGNFDDSRIVEAIAKQRNTPIRAYVVESDITAKQQTARRFEQLAQF